MLVIQIHWVSGPQVRQRGALNAVDCSQPCSLILVDAALKMALQTSQLRGSILLVQMHKDPTMLV
eukprot:CAMPEP_0197633110 /NCGR_PEP_ID=MMETSP1338-20131121/9550_1 /TAXON_ID=43686 ORGANISM="Pelagodinium beii, Strain RCC1491" /NCGR_SAMPLE_ID=MMETSP1338 /ASSEMBLY_ACC=CAM_ASM_000754 /LENGTH=64 /DNA_ID=CAMNT_0043204703 /DNA_START=424 /DNA_END=614 /DNA_ORIENTATION=-